MSIKEATEKVKSQANELRDEVRETAKSISDIPPRPLKNRRTFILRKPIIETIFERRSSMRRKE